MKRCPTCNRTFTDPSLSFCIDDGTPLATVPDTTDETTVVSPSSAERPAQSYSPPTWTTPGYVPPGATPNAQKKRRAWPWVVGILGLLLLAVIGFGVVLAIYLPRMMSTRTTSSSRNANSSNGNFNSGNRNSIVTPNANNANQIAEENSNSNSNANSNTNSDSSGAPTNHDDVLSMLKDIEHDWTVANINADKKALERILADDYVATANGRSLGKREYIDTIKRDTQTQDWKFENLKLDLKGTRATLSGIVRFRISNQQVSFSFVDKFVWRDGRWQATASELSPVS